ncbi:MAG: alpha-glucan family phosphorylase [Planctomycetota bacterium]|jgi:starch phosphorylase
MSNDPIVAFYSMEIALDPAMPTYSGGLGVLSGDLLRSAADLGVPMVGVTLLYRKGCGRQRLDGDGNQSEHDSRWTPEDFLEPLKERASVTIEGRRVSLRAWRYRVTGSRGHEVPVLLLDSDLPENDPADRTLTDHLYGGDERYRLCQETILGMGGVAMLRALRLYRVRVHHMNEGHSALLALALLENGDLAKAKTRCVFTTHTPVAAGHDRFPVALAGSVLGEEPMRILSEHGCCSDGTLNMTELGMIFSDYVNGVSKRHEGVSREMFPEHSVNGVTNGVHAGTWTSPPFRVLFDRHLPDWRDDNRYLRNAVDIPRAEIRHAHASAKRRLVAEVEKRSGVRLDPEIMTLCFARRATPYKRADMLFADLDRLRRIAREAGPLQIVYGGKAHPRDEGGKENIRRIFAAADALRDEITVVYLADYDMELGMALTSGADLWLNTPLKPLEASGTSGMKAALNGVPSLSVLDGWWLEGHVEGVTGWSIGREVEEDHAAEIASLYDKLEHDILPMFYERPMAYARVMRWAVALNGSFFNAQRMVSQYVENAYFGRPVTFRAEAVEAA